MYFTVVGLRLPVAMPTIQVLLQQAVKQEVNEPESILAVKKPRKAHPEVSSEAAIPSAEKPNQEGWVGPTVVQEGKKLVV